MAEGEDQDKSEEATPFKLKRAREKGSVARGTDLSFIAGLAALAGFLAMAGPAATGGLAEMMRRSLIGGISNADDPGQTIGTVAAAYHAALHPVLLFGGTVLALVALVEIVQLRGIVFSAQPLKPDWSRLNPAKGLKRIFSIRTVKEAAKSIVKLTLYTLATTLLVRAALDRGPGAAANAAALAKDMQALGMRLLWTFAVLALVVAAFDQMITRSEFAKQMRMSRRDVTRESKDREGDPRLKRKRKQLHAEFVKRAAGLGALPGSDMLVVNPEHVAVALAYDRTTGAAPMVRAKARDLHALAMKRQARRLRIPIVEDPPLARRLYAECDAGREVAPTHYHAVAGLYFKLGIVSLDSDVDIQA